MTTWYKLSIFWKEGWRIYNLNSLSLYQYFVCLDFYAYFLLYNKMILRKMDYENSESVNNVIIYIAILVAI